jgi:hypothetical protein
MAARIKCWALKNRYGNLVWKPQVEPGEPARTWLFRTRKAALEGLAQANTASGNYYKDTYPVRIVLTIKEV